MLQWLEEEMGGVHAMEGLNQKKASALYGCIDETPFYRCPVEPRSRSMVNVVFNLPSVELESRFVQEAKAAGFVGVAGHRSLGGCRVSLFNGVTLSAVHQLVEFMDAFRKKG